MRWYRFVFCLCACSLFGFVLCLCEYVVVCNCISTCTHNCAGAGEGSPLHCNWCNDARELHPLYLRQMLQRKQMQLSVNMMAVKRRSTFVLVIKPNQSFFICCCRRGLILCYKRVWFVEMLDCCVGVLFPWSLVEKFVSM